VNGGENPQGISDACSSTKSFAQSLNRFNRDPDNTRKRPVAVEAEWDPKTLTSCIPREVEGIRGSCRLATSQVFYQ